MERPHLQLGNRHAHTNVTYIDTKRRRKKKTRNETQDKSNTTQQ
jgi:hypothetical protein